MFTDLPCRKMVAGSRRSLTMSSQICWQLRKPVKQQQTQQQQAQLQVATPYLRQLPAPTPVAAG
jgi:hypothetical protein